MNADGKNWHRNGDYKIMEIIKLKIQYLKIKQGLNLSLTADCKCRNKCLNLKIDQQNFYNMKIRDKQIGKNKQVNIDQQPVSNIKQSKCNWCSRKRGKGKWGRKIICEERKVKNFLYLV